MAKNYGSKQDLEKEGATFKAFKSGSYIAKLSKIEVKEKKNYDNEIVPTLCLQFAPYEANARTPIMKDVDGGTIKALARVLFLDINNVTMGFRENFTIPSKYRALVAALQGIDPNDDVPGPDELTAESAYDQLEEFFGDYVVVAVTAFEKKGIMRNKITDFQTVPDDFEADPVVEAAKKDADKKRAAGKAADSDAPRSRKASAPVEDEELEVEEDGDEEAEEVKAPEKSSKKAPVEKKTRKALF